MSALWLGDERRGDPGWCSCPTCGQPTNDSFDAACRDADARAQNTPVPPKVASLRSLLDDRVSLDRAWRELNDTHARPTSQATIEAILYCVRERGISALQEPANRERLSRCDAAALAQIDDRIVRLRIRVNGFPKS